MEDSIEDIIADTKKMLESTKEFGKECEFVNERINFLINKWNTNKHFFAPDFDVTVEDVIRTVYQRAWRDRDDFENLKAKEL